MSETFGLNLIPLPEGDFGPEEARCFIETDLVGYGSIARAGFGRDQQGDGSGFHLILEDVVTMAAACAEAIVSDEPVKFARNDYGEMRMDLARALFLAEIFSTPDLFVDCDERRDHLLPALGQQVVEFLRAGEREARSDAAQAKFGNAVPEPGGVGCKPARSIHRSDK